jgi:hypothetical protein
VPTFMEEQGGGNDSVMTMSTPVSRFCHLRYRSATDSVIFWVLLFSKSFDVRRVTDGRDRLFIHGHDQICHFPFFDSIAHGSVTVMIEAPFW